MSTANVTPAAHLLGGDYPLNWAGFIGQAQAKAQLMTAARSARKRKVRMDHTLLESGAPGIGKGHPLDTFVATPSGWTQIGNLKVLDEIIGANGQATKVTDIYDRGALPIFRVTFSDGASTLCDGDHLWQVTSRKGVRRTMSVTELLTEGVLDAGNKARFSIPLTAPVEFDAQEQPLDPYLVGVLLANGYLTGTPTIRTNSPTIIERIRQRSPELTINETTSANSTGRGFTVLGITAVMRALKLADHRSGDKHIPPQYLNGSVEQRLELLRGLLDCDGGVRPQRGQAMYFTSSPSLAYGVRYLVESLGGTAAVRSYDYATRTGRELHVGISLHMDVFTTPTKAAIYRPASPRRTMRRIEPAGEAEVRCIRVSAADNLYVTERFVVTHNTTLALLAAAEMRASIRVVSGKMTMPDARMCFAEMKDGDVLIIDEIHQMVAGGKASAEWLLNYMQDGVLLTPLGPEVQPQVTIIAATTDAGRLPETLLTRFGCRPVLVGYTEDEATKIAQGMAKRVFIELPLPTPANARAIALAASFNPRVMRAILHNVRDIALVHHMSNHNGKCYDLTLALEWLGLSPDGLTAGCRKYLKVLLEDFGGQPAGQSSIQDRLQEPGGLGYTERLLMDHGMISKSKSGRLLTQAGVRRAREIVSAAQVAA